MLDHETPTERLQRIATCRATIVYDGDCPVCRQYVRFYRLREALGDVELINARDAGEIPRLISEVGYDLNEGMVFLYAGRVYFAEDAVHQMALLSSRSSRINRFNALVFRSASRARYLYPILKLGRQLLLAILHRRRI